MYYILEIQVYNDGSSGTIITPFADKNEAESKYHTVLAAAAISELPIHTAFMLTADGYVIKSECYRHEQPDPQEVV